MSTATLSDPEVLRALGRGEHHRRAFAALEFGQARRALRSLELIRRRCSPEVPDERTVADLIGRWMRLAAGGDADARDMLTDPFVGIWATGVLRRERPIAGTDAIARLLGPQLGAEDDFTITLDCPDPPLLSRCGGVLGWRGSPRARVRCAAGMMTVTSDGGTAVFQRSGPPTLSGSMVWTATTRVRPAHDVFDWIVAIDNADNASGAIGHGPIDGLDDGAEARWVATIDAAWHLLEDRHGCYAPGIAQFARVLVPQTSDDSLKHVSGSSADGFGAIALSLTRDVPTFAVALVHETQHLKLNALLDVVTLHQADSEPRYYAGWRDDPRPYQALLHGVYAFSAVTEFWRAEYLAQTDVDVRRRYGFEYSLWAAQTAASLHELIDAGVATIEGRHFLAGLEDVVAGWTEPVEAPIASAVGDVMAEHRLNWQLAMGSSPVSVGAGLRRAWRLALTGVDTDPTGGPVSEVDRALVGDDVGAALELAQRRRHSDPSPSNAFRLSRAYAHADMSEQAEAVTAELLTSAGRSAHSVNAGCP